LFTVEGKTQDLREEKGNKEGDLKKGDELRHDLRSTRGKKVLLRDQKSWRN